MNRLRFVIYRAIYPVFDRVIFAVDRSQYSMVDVFKSRISGWDIRRCMAVYAAYRRAIYLFLAADVIWCQIAQSYKWGERLVGWDRQPSRSPKKDPRLPACCPLPAA
jgi:hypothetical protein